MIMLVTLSQMHCFAFLGYYPSSTADFLTCYIIVDRFHFKSHQYNSLNDADQYKNLENVKTSTAEQIKAWIKRALNYICFISRNDLGTPLNISAKHSEVTGKAVTEN